MVDTAKLKAETDCRKLVEADLGQPKRHGAKAWTWRCPLHDEKHGYSLAVWAEGWRCFGACGEGGDAIAWLQRYRHLDFEAACRELGAEELRSSTHARYKRYPVTPVPSPSPAIAEPPPLAWRRAAWKITAEAQHTLWTPEGERALAYLEQQRGLNRTVIWEARLGYIPGNHRQWRMLHGLKVPCGITIPWIVEGKIWALKVRRAAGDVRYEQVGGGNLAGCLYWAGQLLSQWPVLLVEGEFNCLIAWQEAMNFLTPVSLGSASITLNPRWYAALATAPIILACYDLDSAGEKARMRIQELTSRVRFIQVPEGKDINEFYLRCGRQSSAVAEWLEQSLAEAREQR